MASEVQKEIFIWSISGQRKSVNFSRGGMGAGLMVTGTYFCMEMTYLTVVILGGLCHQPRIRDLEPEIWMTLPGASHTTPSCCQAAAFPFLEKGEVGIK